MKMIAAVEREQRNRKRDVDALERERDLLVARLPDTAGGSRARLLHSEHQAKTSQNPDKRESSPKADGIGYGVEWPDTFAKRKSGWKKDDPKHDTPEIRALYRRYRGEEEAAVKSRGLEEVSCLTMMQKSLPGYVHALSELAMSQERQADLEKAMQEALAKAADARGEGEIGAPGSKAVYGGRATVLLEELRQRFGFETVFIDSKPRGKYWNDKNYTSIDDAKKKRTVPAKKATVIGADSHEEIDARVKLDRFLVLGKKMNAASRALWNELERVEFAVGVADSGFHTFVLSAGMVYEIHWNRSPQDPTLTSAKPLKSFFEFGGGDWGSGVIAVPPSVLKPAAPPRQRPHRRKGSP